MRRPKRHIHDPDDADGCLCDIEIADEEVTGDADLPAASGGIATAGAAAGNEEHIDGCDVDFTVDVTSDADLPAAAGGVG